MPKFKFMSYCRRHKYIEALPMPTTHSLPLDVFSRNMQILRQPCKPELSKKKTQKSQPLKIHFPTVGSDEGF